MAEYQRISVSRVAGALGAELSGIDLRQPLEETPLDELRRAFLEHQVLFFRDQDLSRDQHKAFARNWGELQVHPFLQPLRDEGHPEIVVLESDEERPFVASGWHSDVTFSECPPLGSVLRCIETPSYGGDTMWASMYAAYDALSASMQGFLESLTAVHDTKRTFSREDYAVGIGRTEDESLPQAEHPVVVAHPETGRKALFVNSAFTSHIRGLKRPESEALLAFLYRHIESPDFACRFRWQKNSIAMWDNRCTQHRVAADNPRAFRRMERATILSGVAPRAGASAP